ncbi:hypothetical protein FRB94_007892 [Tulasnella sp. JGI-2019a]|nr:hypothetical protein FRB94_007892 [Tulasnella sp. JGI-2019a]
MKRVAMMREDYPVFLRGHPITYSSSAQPELTAPTPMDTVTLGIPDEHAIYDIGGRTIAMATNIAESHTSPQTAGIYGQLDAIPHGLRQGPVDGRDTNRGFLHNDPNTERRFPSLESYRETVSHQHQEGQSGTQCSSKRKDPADDLRDYRRKNTLKTLEPFQYPATTWDRDRTNGHPRSIARNPGSPIDDEIPAPIVDKEPTEEGIIAYLEDNPSKQPNEITNDLTARLELDPLSRRRIYNIVDLHLRTHTTRSEDELIFNYYAENSHSPIRDIVNVLHSKLPRLTKRQIYTIVKYLDHIQRYRNQSKNPRLPGRNEMKKAIEPFRITRSRNKSVTEEQIATVIQFCKEHREMNEAAIISLLARRLDVTRTTIQEIVRHFRRYKGNWEYYVPPSVEEIAESVEDGSG